MGHPDVLQNEPLLNVPLWHVGYFKWKTIKAQRTQEELFASHLSASKNLDQGLVQEESSPHR